VNRIKDIALKANVSVGTVDRVIHNRAGVSESTRERVNKIIEESNFVINPVASSLASKKEYRIAALTPTSIKSEFWKLPNEGIKKCIDEYKTHGFRLQEFNFDKFSSVSYVDAFNEILKWKPSAVIIAPIFFNESLKLTRELEDKMIPYVFINTEIKNVNNLSFIGQNSFDGGNLAGKMMSLMTRENSEIAIIHFHKIKDNHKAIERRIEGFTNYFETYNSSCNLSIHKIDANNAFKELAVQLDGFLKKNPNTKSIFVPSSNAGKIAAVFKKRKISQLNIIGFDTTSENISFLKSGDIDLLIGQQPYKQGYDGVKILVDFLINKQIPKKRYYSSIDIIVKENVEYIDV